MVNDRIRASDADRERVTARLQDHYAEGRLTREELDERVTAVLNAKTFGDMRWVMADLPEPGAVAPAGPPGWAGPRFGPVPAAAGQYRPAFRRGPRVFPLLALVLLLAIVIPGAGKLAIFLLAGAAIFLLLGLTAMAFTATRFLHRARRQWLTHQSWSWHGSLGQWNRWERP